MRRILLLAWRYVAFNRLKTSILVACMTLTLFLPIAVHVLVRHYNAELIARAETTPLVVGAKGNRYDLCLRALYFKAKSPDPIEFGEVAKLRDTGLALPIPVHARFTAHNKRSPIVGTSLDYFAFRGLEVREGTLPLVLGDAVVGSEVAEALSLGPGDGLLSDERSVYILSGAYPLKMHVVGVLDDTGSPDDHGVFVDVKTAWIIEGLTHGHKDVSKEASRDLIIERTDTKVVTTAKIFEYTEVTPDNVGSFHFHGDPAGFPVTAVIVVPADQKSEVILKARYDVGPYGEDRQMIRPLKVIGDLMGIVFKVEMFFKMNFGVVAVSTALFLVLVVLLSLRIRKSEMRTMFKIGASRWTVFWLQATELGMILLMGLAVASLAAGALVLLAPEFVRVL
ncbi:MAG: hypothetical protein ACYSU0_20375 [Planctomycetota bacterium]|jgi:putative ABC transport system permease protein